STLNTLNKNSSALSKSLQKVSSGMKINSAADDASGYAISERMRVQIRGLDQANSNTQNGSSMMKVAEGAVSSTVDILKTLKEKVINAANDSNTDSDRQTIQKELDQSIDQINDNANVTFNGKYLVDGSKNTQGQATFTALTNQSLSTDTTATTKLTELKSRSGDDLEISTTDKVTVSYVQAGKTYTTSFNVTSDTNLKDIFDAAENIDTTSTIFGTNANQSIAKATGTADSAGAMNAAVSADLDVTNAQSSLSVAQASLSVAQTSLSAAQAEVDKAQKIYDADKTAANSLALSNAQTAVATAQSEFNTANSAAISAQEKFDIAQNSAGPALLDGAKIGVAASGDMVSTADGNNAITVTANK
ncbi:flagellin, partial [Selenomonas ruminis]|uniref:flagellin n=1 Tax=Selenomonas ruminis TaxID=2593411 RepID=UPI002102AFBA